MESYFKLAIRLLLAAVLGGIIGYERERARTPAGFRTHIIVCVASALMMLTSEFLSQAYGGDSGPDPSRLGAAVISGIGFLGAGTILRSGANVRGLTTAASLWAVACVGLAVGIGFYAGAIAGSLIIFLTLVLLKRIERNFSARYKTINISTKDIPGQIGIISEFFEKGGATINNIRVVNSIIGEAVTLKFSIKASKEYVHTKMISAISNLEGVEKVVEEE